jgi:hypothetical protein
MTVSGPTFPSKQRFAITCEPCRYGVHEDCRGTIIISGGRLAGSHRCACTSQHPRPEFSAYPSKLSSSQVGGKR